MLKTSAVGAETWSAAESVLKVEVGRTRREGRNGGEFPGISGPAPGSALRSWFVMPIDDLQHAAQKIAGFLASLKKLGGMRLKYRITAGDGAHDPQGLEARQIYVELGGPDVPLVTQHNGELLRALETIAAQMLRLDQR